MNTIEVLLMATGLAIALAAGLPLAVTSPTPEPKTSIHHMNDWWPGICLNYITCQDV